MGVARKGCGAASEFNRSATMEKSDANAMMSFLVTYWHKDRLRFLALLNASLLILVAGELLFARDVYALWWLVVTLVCLLVWYVFTSSYLKGRGHINPDNHYLLLRLWKVNQNGERSVAKAFALLLLMQYPVFHTCALSILAIACIFLIAEQGINEKIASFLDAVYFVCIAATTIGLGDITPKSGLGRLLTVLSSFIGVITFGVVSASCWQAIQSTYILFAGRPETLKEEVTEAEAEGN